MRKRRALSLVLFMFLVMFLFQDGLPLKVAGNAKISLAREFAPVMDSYDLDTYILPYWEGDIVYHESVMVRKEQDGSIPAVSLLYPATEIHSVRSSDLKTVYREGTDWVLQGGNLVILEGSRVPFMTYDEYYPSTSGSNTFATVTGGNIYFSEGSALHKKQLAVTYKHSVSWGGNIPRNKGHLMAKTIAKLKHNEELKILFYGDSIATGANSSGAVGAAPYAETWMDMFKKSLEKTYRNTHITTVNTAVGGKTSEWGVRNAKERVATYSPDLLVIGFGMNDGGLSPAQHKDNIYKIIDVAKGTNPNVEVIIVSTMLPNPEVKMTVGNQVLYESALFTLEAEGIVVAPVTSVHRYLMERKRYSDMTGNNINHPNDFVARLYAQTLIETLMSDDTSVETDDLSTESGTPSTETGYSGVESSALKTGIGTSDVGTSTQNTRGGTLDTEKDVQSMGTGTLSTNANDSGGGKATISEKAEVEDKDDVSEDFIIILSIASAIVVLVCEFVVVLLCRKK